MTPEERQLIEGLFERMRGFGRPQKDREAETLINQSVRTNPDAPYMLVQSVLVQEQALEAANRRIQELEDELRAVEDQQQPSRGGFLSGGLFGGGRGAEERRTASVPQVGGRSGSQSGPFAYGGREGATRDEPPPPLQAGPPTPASGGFMRSALATAAGVAGGMLVADSLRNMLGGSAHAGQTPGQGTGAGSASAADSKNPLAGPDAGQDPGRGSSAWGKDGDEGATQANHEDSDWDVDGGDMDV